MDYLRKQDRDRACSVWAIAQTGQAKPARSRTSRTRPVRDRISPLRETQPELGSIPPAPQRNCPPAPQSNCPCLGLTTSYKIVVEKHRGSLECVSAIACGTEFIIEIPIRQVPQHWR